MSLLQAWRQTDRAQGLMHTVGQHIEEDLGEGHYLTEKADKILQDLEELNASLEAKMEEEV